MKINMLLKQQSLLGLLTFRQMGNLELNPSQQKPLERKPIFLTPSNKKGQGLCRSLSPYISNTKNSYINRSIINKRGMKNSYVSHLSYHNNRVYINPKMIKSVIKNTSVSSSLIKSNTSRIIKPRINADESSMISLNKSPRNVRHSPIFMEKFIQKPFQSSPIRTRVTYKDLDQSLFYKQQKQNLSLITQQEVITPKGTYRQKIQNSTNKSPFNSSKKAIKFDNCTGKVLNYEGKAINSCRHSCCCHRICTNYQYCQQASNQFDNFPTQRKKEIKKKQQIQETIQINNNKKKMKKYNYFQQSDNDITINNKHQLNPSMIHQQNRQKCQEIIKRVRNFNEFLNQVKNKIKKQADSSSSYNNTLDNISLTQLQSFNNVSPNTSMDHNSIGQQAQSHTRSITLALKLQNQRIQLEKYRKLVERQLSKQHSIESIQIDSKNKEKIITINFQKKPKKQQNEKSIKQVEQSRIQNQQQQIQIPPLKSIRLNQPKLSNKQKQKKEHKDTQQKNDISKRLNSINKLFNKMQGMNKIQTQTHRQILQIIKNQPDLDQYEEDQKQQSSK